MERIRTGEYGLCESWRDEDSHGTIDALPYATLCIECQREAERTGNAGGAAGDWGRVMDTSSGDAELSINDIELDVS